ncbi:hypothetical protein OSSY52_19520 [Tepiditoga spiralis]|uniref:Uncharacterized protein n=1 Tax=Tepiditoga spiralis TaxID=2108365 RepID=A0A7G1G5W4_9BACT|nr:hypothetical protein OSSY52_19520 [Tepiditoga spiralis]
MYKKYEKRQKIFLLENLQKNNLSAKKKKKKTKHLFNIKSDIMLVLVYKKQT